MALSKDSVPHVPEFTLDKRPDVLTKHGEIPCLTLKGAILYLAQRHKTACIAITSKTNPNVVIARMRFSTENGALSNAVLGQSVSIAFYRYSKEVVQTHDTSELCTIKECYYNGGEPLSNYNTVRPAVGVGRVSMYTYGTVGGSIGINKSYMTVVFDGLGEMSFPSSEDIEAFFANPLGDSYLVTCEIR